MAKTGAIAQAQLRFRRALGLGYGSVGTVLFTLALAVACVGAYAITVPGMVQAKLKRTSVSISRAGDLPALAGYVVAASIDQSLFDGTNTGAAMQGAEDGSTDGVSSTTYTTLSGLSGLTGGSLGNIIQGAGESAGQDATGDSIASVDDSGSSGGQVSVNGGSSGGSGNDSSTADDSASHTESGGNTGDDSSDVQDNVPSPAEEEELHSWLVSQANKLESYMTRVDAALATYESTGSTKACVSLDNELEHERGVFGRKSGVSMSGSVWTSAFDNLWGCYTNLDIYVASCGEDTLALQNFNNFYSAVAL